MKTKKHKKKSLRTSSLQDPQAVEAAPMKTSTDILEDGTEQPEPNTDTENVTEKQRQIIEPPKQREETPKKVSKTTEEVIDGSKIAELPQPAVRAKTFYGQSSKKVEPPKDEKNEQDRPKMLRSKTTVEKPKSKACNLM